MINYTGTIILTSKHAIGLRSQSGVELLVHIGMDTVTLEGKPFALKAADGAAFKKGDLLVEFDKEFIVKNGLRTITPVIVTNSHAYQEIIIEDSAESALNKKIFTLVS